MKKYSLIEIEGICEEIEKQWENHLTCRAVFFAGMKLNTSSKSSPPYYVSKGIDIKFQIPIPLPTLLERTLTDTPNWLNQNYIIRLFGILDAPGLLKAGKNQQNPYTEILGILRSKVGAHSSGNHSVKKGDGKKVQKLIHDHLDTNFDIKDLDNFNLSIDTVLERLKEHCIEFVKSMQDKEKPDRSPAKKKWWHFWIRVKWLVMKKTNQTMAETITKIKMLLKKTIPYLLLGFILSLVFGNLLVDYLKVDIFPTTSFSDIRNVIVFIGVVALGFFLAYPLINFKRIKIGEYLEIEKDAENTPPISSGSGPIAGSYNSYDEVIGKIRDNFLHLGNFRKNEGKYLEAHSFYFSAHNMSPSMLSAFRALESFCYYLNSKNSNNDSKSKISKEDVKTILAWFDECLKKANEERKAWRGREDFKDQILKIQNDSIGKISEEKAELIFEGMTK